MFYHTTERIADTPYYQEAAKLLEANQHAIRRLGSPVRFRGINLGNNTNCITTTSAELLVPVGGCRSSGIMHLWASRRNAADGGLWHLDSVHLELEKPTCTMKIL